MGRRMRPERSGVHAPVTAVERDSYREAAYLAAPVAAREQRHRRVVLLAAAALIFFSMSPVFGHHLSGSVSGLLAGMDHLGAICLVALRQLLAPVHELFHVLLIAGLAYAVWDRGRAWHALRRALRALAHSPPTHGDPFWRASQEVGLDMRRVRVVDGLPNPAFTAGWLRPEVFVARALAERLSVDELTAVLAHEAAHVRRRDPLRLSILRLLSHTLFWIPALRRLADDLTDEAEIAADDAAARATPRVDALVVASTILKLASWRDLDVFPADGAVATGFQRPDLLDRRIRRLAGEDTPLMTHVTRRSVGGALSALAIVWISGLAMVHPLPAADSGHAKWDHCEHHHALAIMHLFCPGFNGGAGLGPCPHAVP